MNLSWAACQRSHLMQIESKTNADKKKYGVIIVLWFKANTPPLRYIHEAPNYPDIQLSNLLLTGLELDKTSYIDVYDGRVWITQSATALLSVPESLQDQNILIRLRPLLLVALPLASCLEMDEEIALYPRSQRGVKRRADDAPFDPAALKRVRVAYRIVESATRILRDEQIASYASPVTSSQVPEPLSLPPPVVNRATRPQPSSTPAALAVSMPSRKQRINGYPLKALPLPDFIRRFRHYNQLTALKQNDVMTAYGQAFGDVAPNLVKSSFHYVCKPVRVAEVLMFRGRSVSDIFIEVGDAGNRESLQSITDATISRANIDTPYLSPMGCLRLQEFLKRVNRLDLLEPRNIA